MNLFLVGARGSGKTTVGRLVAAKLSWNFIDTDAEVVRAAGRTIREIIASSGEPAFRTLEALAAAEAARQDRAVIALGGGALLRPENEAAVAGRGAVVWLRAAAETLAARVAADPATPDGRPALTPLAPDVELRRLLAEREPGYRRLASWILDTDARNPADLAAEIAAWQIARSGP